MPTHSIIFDIDGTLLDSNAAHADAFVMAMNEHGFRPSPETVRRLIGKGSDKLLPESIGVEADSSIGSAIGRRKTEIFQQHWLPRLRPTPGARALAAHLSAKGLRLAAASSASKDELGRLLAQATVDDLIKCRISADDVAESKPDPDVVEAALRKLGAHHERDRVVMIGDTPYDVTAAQRAHVRCIALRCGGWIDRDLAGAVARYDDPAHLLRELASSPLAAWTASEP